MRRAYLTVLQIGFHHSDLSMQGAGRHCLIDEGTAFKAFITEFNMSAARAKSTFMKGR